MRYSILAGLLACGSLFAQVTYNASDKTISIDGKPFTTFHPGEDANKPYLAPLRSVSGKIVTRKFPMEMVEGESRDHLHHRGLWFSYDDVNGVKFWENDPSYKRGKIGRIVVRDVAWKAAGKNGKLLATMDWRDPDGKTLLVEHREMRFYDDKDVRKIDFLITLQASEDVVLGDTKEGAFAIRLAEPFTERKGGKIVDSEGREKMAKVWGKRASWVDYSCDLEGEKTGVAIMDHPGNPNHPTYWHARDYGLFSLNPFGQHAFDPDAPERSTKLAKGQKLTFRWRVLIHPGDAQSGKVAESFKEFAASR